MSRLTPEQRRVLEVFLKYFQSFHQSQVQVINDLSVDDVTIENSAWFVLGNIGRKSLPHDSDWIWNQSKPKVNIPINSTEHIIITKLNPRKYNKSTEETIRPKYKLWDCEIISPRFSKDTPIHFIWVEKGKPNPYGSCLNDITFDTKWIFEEDKNSSEDLHIQDFSFLKDFIEPHLALQFGWLE